MHIRAATEADRQVMLAIINGAAMRYRGVIPADRWHEPYMSVAELDREIADGVVFSVAEDEEGVSGVMGIQDRGDVALVRHAYVAPGRQRTGVGTAFIAGELERAWNAVDGAGFARAFTENADFINIRGEHFRGREVIAQGHQGIFDSIYKGSRVSYEPAGGSAVAPAVRVGQVRGHLRVPSGPLAGELNALATLVLVEQDGEWRIVVFHNTAVAQPPAR